MEWKCVGSLEVGKVPQGLNCRQEGSPLCREISAEGKLIPEAGVGSVCWRNGG